MGVELYQNWAEVEVDRVLQAWLDMAGPEPGRYFVPESLLQWTGAQWPVVEALIAKGYVARLATEARTHPSILPCRLTPAGYHEALRLRNLANDWESREIYAEEAVFRWVYVQAAGGNWVSAHGFYTFPASWYCGTKLPREVLLAAGENLVNSHLMFFNQWTRLSRLTPTGYALARSGYTVREYMTPDQQQPNSVTYHVSMGNVNGSALAFGNSNEQAVTTGSETSELDELLAELRRIAAELPQQEAEDLRGYTEDLAQAGDDPGRARRVWRAISPILRSLVGAVTPERVTAAIEIGERIYRAT